MKTWIIAVALASAPVTTVAQFDWLRGSGPAPSEELLQSRVSIEDDADYRLNVSEFIVDITERLGECERLWYEQELVFVLECLAVSESGDVLLQFQLEWYPRQGISRLAVFDGFDGVAYRSAREVLRNLPMTAAEIETRAEMEYQWQLLREKFEDEFGSWAREFGNNGDTVPGPCDWQTRAFSVAAQLWDLPISYGSVAESLDFSIPDLRVDLNRFAETVANIELLLSEWQLVRNDCLL